MKELMLGGPMSDISKDNTADYNPDMDAKLNPAPQNQVMTPGISGATSSHSSPDFHLIPSEFIRRVAQRYTEGRFKHGDVNYQKCIKVDDDYATIELDVAFARDRYNHCIEHLTALKSNTNNWDDNLGAAGWFISFAVWIETYGFEWKRILNPKYVNEIKFIRTTNKLIVETKDGKKYTENAY